MREKLENRLTALKAEFEAGQNMLAQLENKELNLRNTLIRISGAIQVLEEELNKADAADVVNEQETIGGSAGEQ